MRSELSRRGFLGALGALTALVVATPLLAREVEAPPEELTAQHEDPVRRGCSADITTCSEIFKKLYSKSVPAQLARGRHPMLAALGSRA